MIADLDLCRLIDELRKQPTETEWVEFKHNNADPKMVAERVSALANSAALLEVSHGYLVWGIEDETHDILGTTFDYRRARKGDEELENWLHHVLSPNASFQFDSIVRDGLPLVILQIDPAYANTVDFEHEAYIRVGSYTKKLKDYPSIEADLWSHLGQRPFEEGVARHGLRAEEAIDYLDYPKYFSLTGIPMPLSLDEILKPLCDDGILGKQEDGLYSITNLGALLLAKEIEQFPAVSRKALRIVQYHGSNKIDQARERVSKGGYAVDFESAIEYLMAITPSDEPIVSGVRQEKTLYPEVAFREVLANALIHQDLRVRGSGPLVEVFDERVEFSNPGSSFVEPLRLVDSPPRSRNQGLASMMRRFRLCEELGTGWDKLIDACEKNSLPAPEVRNYPQNGGNMCVILRPYISYRMLSAEDRAMICYWHALSCYMKGETMSNSSLRQRFGGDAPSAATISRLIRDTVSRGLIHPTDPNASNRYMRYVPYWA